MRAGSRHEGMSANFCLMYFITIRIVCGIYSRSLFKDNLPGKTFHLWRLATYRFIAPARRSAFGSNAKPPSLLLPEHYFSWSLTSMTRTALCAFVVAACISFNFHTSIARFCCMRTLQISSSVMVLQPLHNKQTIKAHDLHPNNASLNATYYRTPSLFLRFGCSHRIVLGRDDGAIFCCTCIHIEA